MSVDDRGGPAPKTTDPGTQPRPSALGTAGPAHGWVVILRTGTRDEFVAYGPTDDEDTARDFAAFLNREVDPATVVPLWSPTRELLAFYAQFMAEVDRNNRVPADPPQSPVEHVEAASEINDRSERCASRGCERAAPHGFYCCTPCAVGDVARGLNHHAPDCVKVRAT